jgi:hypothetical protein
MSAFTPTKSPKHSKDYYSDYINAEDRLDVEITMLPHSQGQPSLQQSIQRTPLPSVREGL